MKKIIIHYCMLSTSENSLLILLSTNIKIIRSICMNIKDGISIAEFLLHMLTDTCWRWILNHAITFVIRSNYRTIKLYNCTRDAQNIIQKENLSYLYQVEVQTWAFISKWLNHFDLGTSDHWLIIIVNSDQFKNLKLINRV